MNNNNEIIYQILASIQEKLGFSIDSMNKILNLSNNQYQKWVNSKKIDIDNEEVVKKISLFVEIYDKVLSLFVHNEKMTEWYRTPILKFKKSPLELIRDEKDGLQKLKDYINEKEKL